MFFCHSNLKMFFFLNKLVDHNQFKSYCSVVCHLAIMCHLQKACNNLFLVSLAIVISVEFSLIAC
jgi:hypothetical protein